MWLSKGLQQSIKELYLSNNKIRETGCKFLSKAIKYLEVLSLTDNFIGNAGCINLAKNLSKSSLKKLFLDNNSISLSGGNSILSAIPQGLTRLRLDKN